MNAKVPFFRNSLLASAIASVIAVAPLTSIAATSVIAATDPVRHKAVIVDEAAGTLSIARLDTLEIVAQPLAGEVVHTVLVNAVSGTAYALVGGTLGRVVAIDVETGRLLGMATVGNGASHLTADFTRGELYVANHGDASISFLHAATLKVFSEVNLGAAPDTSAIDVRRGLLYVVSSTNATVSVLDLESRQMIAQVAVGSKPASASVDESSGKVYVNNAGDRTVSVVDPAGFAVVRTIPVGAGATSGTISSVHRRYYLPNADDNRLSVIDTREDQLVALLPIGRSPREAVLSASEDEVYVVSREDTDVAVVDSASARVTGRLSTGTRPAHVVVLHDRLLMVKDGGSDAQTDALSATPMHASDTALATEYVDAGRARYLHTAKPLEARLIADGLYGDTWRRTMRFFRVWTGPGAGRVPVCRFSRVVGTQFDHVFAATPDECASLTADPAWTDEGVAYYAALPDSAGRCATGTEPLYRLYNNGVNGIGAHRYVASAGVSSTMIAAGWIAEGYGVPAVFACVPELRPGSVQPIEHDETTPEIRRRVPIPPVPRIR